MTDTYQGSYSHGSADRAHDTSTDNPWNPSYLPSDLIDPVQQASRVGMPTEFITIVQIALAQNGVNAGQMSISQVYQLATIAWNDPLIQKDYKIHEGAYRSVTDYPTGSSSGVVADIVNQLFVPGSSSNSQLLSMGVGLLQQQGKPLSAAQTKFSGDAQSPVPKPFAGNYPVTLDYGQPWGGETEAGIDYATPVNTPLSSPFSGTIHLEDGGTTNWGKRVMVKLDNGWTFAIGHMTAFSVQEGQKVNPGELLGYSGGAVGDPSSGMSSGPHIEVQWMNPQGGFTDPHVIMDPILAGTTFGAIGEAGALGQGVTPPRFPGDDPLLDTQYPGVVSVWQKYFGSPPTGTQIRSVVGNVGQGASGAVAAGAMTVTQMAQQVGFTAEEAKTLAAISVGESSGNPNAVGPQWNGDAGSIGLLQIQTGAHPDLVQKYGGIEGLKDPLNNIKAAYDVFVAAGRSFSPWSVFTNGDYLNHMGQDPTVSTKGGQGTTGALDNAQIENTIRGLPSHVPGMNAGQYTDMKSLADSISQQALGHASTDGIIAELFHNKQTSKGDVQDWYNTHSPNEMNAAQYANIVQASQPYMQNVYNQNGFDPRVAQHIWSQQQSGGGTGPAPVYQQPRDPSARPGGHGSQIS